MNKTKSSSQSAHSTIRPVSISTTTKFQKLQQVNNLVNEISQKEQVFFQKNGQKPIVNTRQIKTGTGEKVLQMLKNRIKTNYEHLYNNYGDNKQKIIKQIQAVQTNIAGQNAMTTRFDDIVKQKARHDKLKADVQNKQKRLRKYNDMKKQLIEQATARTMNDPNNVLLESMTVLEEKRINLEHESAILQNMLKNRKKIQLNLSQKYNKLFQQNSKKRERSNKLHVENLKKQKMIKNIQERLFKDQDIDIPTSLAEQLSQKIQLYENKHSYDAIVQHEAILEEERYKKLKQETQIQRELQRQKAKKRQTEEKNQLEELYNIYLIKNMELQKIKKLCAVDSIEAVIGSDGSLDSKNLQQIKVQIQRKIQEQQSIRQSFQSKIQSQMNRQGIQSQINADSLQNTIENQKKKEMLLKLESNKKQELYNQWAVLLDLMKVKPKEEELDNLLTSLEADYIRSQGQAKSQQSHKTRLMDQIIQQYQKEQEY